MTPSHASKMSAAEEYTGVDVAFDATGMDLVSGPTQRLRLLRKSRPNQLVLQQWWSNQFDVGEWRDVEVVDEE